ncbi:UNVERIFIED_CONTAM: hypothetical protein GTU68_015758 [Idotea baltica]|nr:hypothetical protein [Idotea baltica]
MTEISDIDFDYLNKWVGKTETATDIVTSGLIERFHATFGGWLYKDGERVPLGLHWCLSPLVAPLTELGPDGHPARGGFLPPVPLENRMWAGGRVSFYASLEVDKVVARTSRIASLTPKIGRSGPLIFVSVDHDYRIDDRLIIEERQDIVYRTPQPQPTKIAAVQSAAKPGDFVGDPVTLFRYSALTFNSHRIHFDHPYVTEKEGYAGLVVHGPLQATLLMNAAAVETGTSQISFDYRGLSPLIAGQAVSLRKSHDKIWLEKASGDATFEGRFSTSEPESPTAHD